jgi:hypothetical protein
MIELAVHETLLNASCSMLDGIVAMPDWPCWMRTSPARQYFGERLQYVDAEVVAVKSLSIRDPICKHNAVHTQKDHQHLLRRGNGPAHPFWHFIS